MDPIRAGRHSILVRVVAMLDWLADQRTGFHRPFQSTAAKFTARLIGERFAVSHPRSRTAICAVYSERSVRTVGRRAALTCRSSIGG